MGGSDQADPPLCLVLAGQYECHWRDYSSVRNEGGGIVRLRYLLLSVQPKGTDVAS